MTPTSTNELRVAAARDLGPLFVNNPNRMVGQDGAFSIPLTGRRAGQTLWFFGDTLVGTRPRGHSLWTIDDQPVGHADMTGRGTFEQMINNTGLLVPTRAGPESLREFEYIVDAGGRLKNLIPLTSAEHADWDRIWCQHGVGFGEDQVCLSFIKVRMQALNTTPLPIGFDIVGSGLAVGDTDTWAFRRITQRGSDILWAADQPHFSTAFVAHPRDGNLYLYGSVKHGEGPHACYLACVEPAQIAEVETYKYLTSPDPRWSANVADAAPLFRGMPSEMSVSYNAYLGCFLAVHSLDLTGAIVARTAPEPWGPWSEPVKLWQVRPQHAHPRPYAFDLIYAGKEHPELARNRGRVLYVTYIEFEEYYPHLIEVELE